MSIAVVFVSYLKVPEERLLAHFEWNREVYSRHGVRVYVVTDTEHPLPDYAECVLFPMDRLPMVRGQRRFSLAMTKNAGNVKAIADGASVVCCTDVDIQLFDATLEAIQVIDERTAIIPVYSMAPRSGAVGHLDRGCTGTVAMTANNWRRLPYEEKCVGYGADDGILLRDIERAGLRVVRDHVVTHVAHVDGDGERQPGKGAESCWGRDDGFNFDNFAKNRRLHRGRQ